MKLYERIENNNFDEIDKNRAIELIEGGNGHLVYNEDYFKLQKENEELNNRCRNLDKEAQAYLEELAGDNTLTRRTIKQLQEENEELKNKLSLKQFDVNIVYNDYLEKLDEYERNNIPKQKIKDKIEHYQKLQHNYIEKYDEINEGLQAMISALQELLGKE